MSKGSKAALPDIVVQEIRALCSIHARDIMLILKGDGLDLDNQKETLENCFHGSVGYSSTLDAFMEGKGWYAPMWIKHPLEINRENNQLRTNGEMWELDPKFHLHQDLRFVLHDPGFTRKDLAVTKETRKEKAAKLKGRVVNDKSLSVLATYKFALKFHDEYMKNGNYPSGKGFDDMVLYVRQKCYEEFWGAKNMASANKKKEKRPTADEMPPNYVFTGFYCFMLLGPQGLSDVTLPVLAGKSSDKIPKMGRAAIRAMESESRDVEREAGMGSTGVYKRGTSKGDTTTVSSTLASTELSEKNIAISHMRESNKYIAGLLAENTSSRNVILKSLAQLQEMLRDLRAAAREDGISDAEHEGIAALQSQQGELLAELSDLTQKKKKLLESSELLLQDTMQKRYAFGVAAGCDVQVPSVVRFDETASLFSGCTPTIARSKVSDDRTNKRKEAPILAAAAGAAVPGTPLVDNHSARTGGVGAPYKSVLLQESAKKARSSDEVISVGSDDGAPKQLYPLRQPSQLSQEEEECQEVDMPALPALPAMPNNDVNTMTLAEKIDLLPPGLAAQTRRYLESNMLDARNAQAFYAREEGDEFVAQKGELELLPYDS